MDIPQLHTNMKQEPIDALKYFQGSKGIISIMLSTFKGISHLSSRSKSTYLLRHGETEIATLVKYEPQKWRSSLNTVKAYVKDGEALSFSRTNENYPFKHIGIYAYRTDILAKIAKLPITALEKATSLEQLRWITHGYKIKCIETTLDSPSIDTPEDLCELLKTLK